MSRRSKRHHIVPQTLQRHFCNSDGKLWYSAKAEQGSYDRPEQRTPKGAFWMRDYYTVLENDNPSDSIETGFYGSLDNFLGELIPQLLLRLQAGEAPTMDVGLVDNLRVAIFEMIKRSPDFIAVDDYEVGLEFLEEMLAQKGNGTVEEDRLEELQAELMEPHKVRARGRDIRVRGSLSRSANVESALEGRSFRYAVAPERHSFILSNMIAYRIGNGGSNGLHNANSEVWMPISPRYALVMVNDPDSKIPLVCQENRDHIRAINEFAVANSRSIASHSQKLAFSLTGHRNRGNQSNHN